MNKITPNQPITSLVILLHGYGADGGNLISIAKALAPGFPNTLFLSPDAPYPCESGFGGYQWFSLRGNGPDISLEHISQNILEPAANLSKQIQEILRKHKLHASNLVIAGFSQGAAMALQVGFDLASNNHVCAGIIGFSGGLGNPIPQSTAYPPVLLVHGTADDVWGHEASVSAAQAMELAGVKVNLQLVPNLGHSIDMFGLNKAADFMKAAFN